MLKAVFFDFDGVILESADIKTRAFGALFKGVPQRARIVKYHLQNAGLSRYVKFDHTYKHILKKPLPPAKRRRLGRSFSALVLKKVLSCPMVPGAKGMLARHASRLEFYVTSGTPQAELRGIVRRRGLGKYFRGVHGSPRKKGEIISTVLRRRRFSPKETAYVGDALSDMRAAKSHRVPFVGRVPRGKKSPFPAGTTIVKDMAGFSAWIDKRMS